MKGLVITTENKMFVRDFGEPLYKTLGEAVDGYIEVVHPMGLEFPCVMIVNEEGLLKGLKKNTFGCFLYGTRTHGQPITGNIVIMKEGLNDDGEQDIIGLNGGDIMDLLRKHGRTFKLLGISATKDPKVVTS